MFTEQRLLFRENLTYRFLKKKDKIYANEMLALTQLCLAVCGPMDCTLPGSSAHGILQAKILEWVAIS